MNRYTSHTFSSLSLVVGGRVVKIRTLLEAANALLAHWVDDDGDGEEYIVAVKTCLDAITGSVSAEDARAAFVRAAEEAGMRIITLVYSADVSSTGARTAA